MLLSYEPCGTFENKIFTFSSMLLAQDSMLSALAVRSCSLNTEELPKKLIADSPSTRLCARGLITSQLCSQERRPDQRIFKFKGQAAGEKVRCEAKSIRGDNIARILMVTDRTIL